MLPGLGRSTCPIPLGMLVFCPGSSWLMDHVKKLNTKYLGMFRVSITITRFDDCCQLITGVLQRFFVDSVNLRHSILSIIKPLLALGRFRHGLGWRLPFCSLSYRLGFGRRLAVGRGLLANGCGRGLSGAGAP